MKKSLFNLSWFWVSVAVLLNIFIFLFLSHHLEGYVAETIAKRESIDL